MNKKMSPPERDEGGDYSSGLIETTGKQKTREVKNLWSLSNYPAGDIVPANPDNFCSS